MRHSVLADMFSVLKNAEGTGKRSCFVPSSRVTKAVLEILKKHGYIESLEVLEESRGARIKVGMKKRINDCNVIRPHFDVKAREFTRFEKRFLPSFNIGILILTTSKGVMDHAQAKEKGLGGKLLGYVY